MEKWRKKIGLALMSAGLFFMSPTMASANDCGASCDPCDPCDWSFCDGGFEIGVDFLWWKPCVDDLDYAAQVTGTTTAERVKYKSVCPDWEPGVRVTVGLPGFFCDWDLVASYTYIESDDSSSTKYDQTATGIVGVAGTMLHPDILSTTLYNKARADWNLSYHEWDLLFTTDLSCKPCHHFMPFFGIAGVSIDQEFDVKYELGLTSPTIYKASWEDDYWGIGLRAGSEYLYRMNECMSFFAKASATLLTGEADSKYKAKVVDASDNIELKDDDCCHFVPGYHISAGIIWDSSWCEMDFSAKLGYEFTNWCNLPRQRSFSGTADLGSEVSHGTSSSNRNLGFHGISAGFAMSF